MDDINGDFKDADVVLVVGANDVVNPAAKTTPGAPIYGMPILNADEAKQVIFMKRSMRPGFAGIENELLFDEQDHPALRRRQGHDGQAAQRGEGALAHRTSPRILLPRTVARGHTSRVEAVAHGEVRVSRVTAAEQASEPVPALLRRHRVALLLLLVLGTRGPCSPPPTP